jgi:catechol 2,3-dioxygenase-like lactoylglutathione lyase family enzyme
MAVGALDHVYYWTADMDAAVAFYGDVIGLRLVRREGSAWAEFDAGPIRFALHGGAADGVPTGGTAVFEVDDLDSARLRLRERGVAFDQEDGEVPGLARFASFRDPDGNVLQIIEYLRS